VIAYSFANATSAEESLAGGRPVQEKYPGLVFLLQLMK